MGKIKRYKLKMNQFCQSCKSSKVLHYELYTTLRIGEQATPHELWLCVKCARSQRRTENPNSNSPVENFSRIEFIAELDRFWNESGAGEICRQCHEQGTGCCPPMCRNLSSNGCRQKNVFCTGFTCSALLNAISECDAETGRTLKWVRKNAAPTEFRLYECVTRVPPIDREDKRPFTLQNQFPKIELEGEAIKQQLQELTGEVLEIRRLWSK
jgi:hypothetical protein